MAEEQSGVTLSELTTVKTEEALGEERASVGIGGTAVVTNYSPAGV